MAMLLSKLFSLFQFNRVLEGGLASAAVLISLGALLGKLNPFQILMLSIIEAPIFVLNSYLGYTILGVADVGNISRLHHCKNWWAHFCSEQGSYTNISSEYFVLGGAIFIHAFGAYFGLAVSIMHRRRNMALSENMESSKYASDIFAMVCELKN